MYEFVLVIHVILAALLIGLVLLQQGKSGGMGTAFGGATEALLSTPTASNMLSRATGIIATLFFVTSLSLGYLAAQKSRQMQQDLLPSMPAIDLPLESAVDTEQSAAASEVPMQQDVPVQNSGSVPQ